MRRRDVFVLFGGAAVLPQRAGAQSAPGLPLIAVLWPSTVETTKDFDAALRNGLKDGGLVEGTNFAFAMRYADADFARFAPLAIELAALKPRMIITASDGAALVVHRTVPDVPLVMYINGDPVAMGLAASYARPGGTVT
jgi:putative tryptophan/tyrosine transport system substrate-binding protein